MVGIIIRATLGIPGLVIPVTNATLGIPGLLVHLRHATLGIPEANGGIHTGLDDSGMRMNTGETDTLIR